MERERERESSQFPFHDISGRERIAEDDDGDNPIERDKIQPGGSSGKTLHKILLPQKEPSRVLAARASRETRQKRRTTRAESLTADDMFTRVRACVRGKVK